MSKITTKETNKLKKELEKNIKIFNQYIVQEECVQLSGTILLKDIRKRITLEKELKLLKRIDKQLKKYNAYKVELWEREYIDTVLRCPYCGGKLEEAWVYKEEGGILFTACDKCGKKFQFKKVSLVRYQVYRINE